MKEIDYSLEYQKEFAHIQTSLIREIDRYEQLKEKYKLALDENSKHVNALKKQLFRKIHVIDDYEGLLSVIRVGNEKDEREKIEVLRSFSSNWINGLEDDQQFYYHGCKRIDLVQKIIESKRIVSGSYRTGVETSMDDEDVFSVTSNHNFSITLDDYAGLKNPSYLPAGAIFVLKSNEEHYDNKSLMENVFLDQNPERLVAIFTTNENKEKLKKWLIENDFDDSICYTYDEAIENIHLIGKEGKHR